MKSLKERPVTGADLIELRKRRGHSVADMCWLTGLPPTRWSQLTGALKDQPVEDAALDLLVRILLAEPKLDPLPKTPALDKLYSSLIRDGVTKQDFGLILGRNASSGYQWVELHKDTTATVRRLSMIFERRRDPKRGAGAGTTAA